MYKVLTTGGNCFIIDFTKGNVFITNTLTKQEGENIVKLVRTHPISTVEYGSTFQGLANKNSDKDLCTIVVRPLADSFLSNVNNGSVHDKNNDRYYSVEKFIQLILKGSSDLVTILLAHMNNGDEPIKRLLKTMYIPGSFDSYMRSIGQTYLMSLVGELKKSFKKNDTKDLTCKQLLRELVAQKKAQHYFDVLTDYKKMFRYDTFMEDSIFGFDNEEKEFYSLLIENKSNRVSDVDWSKYNVDTDFPKWVLKYRQDNTESIIKNINALKEEGVFKPFRYENDLKDDMVRFLINEHKGVK